MEETKVNETPVTEEVKKLSYEELETVAKDLYNRCTEMAKEIQRMQVDNTFKRLDYLFKTLEYYSLLDTDFVRSCAKEIQEIMTIPETETANKKE